ncbi:hypothetical protein F511_08938 [Dorcoceras hygrometricum]|uniref:Uncharacterized protein n=1 Tax=Dorcoceras hygrometricum TaxID=472368 RepID=A0A2Z7AA01_9LAMI|nr:hypothetical protein F511_08938 [Dorcoceras hygrometricum]
MGYSLYIYDSVSLFGRLQPFGSHNFCRALVVIGTVRDLEEGPVFSSGIFRRVLDVQLISSSSNSSSSHPDLTSLSNNSSSESLMDFTADIPQIVQSTTATPQISLPAATIPTTDFTGIDKLKTNISSRIFDLERAFAAADTQQEQVFRGAVMPKRGKVVEGRSLLLTIKADLEMEGADPVVVVVGANLREKEVAVEDLTEKKESRAVGPQPLWLRNHNSGLAQRIMVKRLATSPHDPLGITDSACKNQLVVVSVQYGPFNTYIPIRSTTIGKSRVARDPIAMHTSWRSNSDIASVTSIGYPRMRASGESSTTKHRLLHASGSHPIPPPNDPKTNQYNQDLGHIHSTNGNHLESPNEGSSIDHQVTIYLHAQNITMFPTNETRYFASQILVSISGGLILILTAQSTRNVFRMHSDY